MITKLNDFQQKMIEKYKTSMYYDESQLTRQLSEFPSTYAQDIYIYQINRIVIMQAY